MDPVKHERLLFFVSGQFESAEGGQFKSVRGGQFGSVSGGQLHRFLHALIRELIYFLKYI